MGILNKLSHLSIFVEMCKWPAGTGLHNACRSFSGGGIRSQNAVAMFAHA